MERNTAQNSKRIAKNSILLTIRLIITMCISIYTSRVILNVLGVEDYGVYNVVGGFVGVFSSLTNSLGRAFSRFVMVAIAKNDIKGQQQVFSVNINILIGLIFIILVICEIVGSWYFLEKVNIPKDRFSIINTVFQLSLLSFVLSLGKVPCISLIISHEKSGAYALIGIVDAILKLSIVYLLLLSDIDKLILYCSLLAGVNLLSLIYTSIYCWVSFEGFKYVKDVPRKLYNEMLGFASWNFVALSASVCNAQGIVLVVNKFCGVIVNAALGIVSQVEACTRQFVTSIAFTINPQIVKSYTIGDIPYMQKLVVFATKCFAFIVLYYAIPFSVEADTILHLWLGVVPDYTANLLRLVFCCTLFMVMANPLEVAVQATGKVRRFQLITSFILIVSLPITWVILYTGGNVYIVYIALIVLYFIMLLIQYFNTRHITEIPVPFYFCNVVLRIILTSLIAAILQYFITQSIAPSFSRLCFSCISSLIITTICIIFIGFTKEESIMVLRLVKSFIKRQ